MSQTPAHVPATNATPSTDSAGRALPVVQRVCAPILLVVAAVLMIFPVLHVHALVHIWDTPELPATWPLNLGIALLVGIGGFFIWGAGWRMLRRGYALGERAASDTRATKRPA